MISEVPVLAFDMWRHGSKRFSAENVALATTGVTALRGAGGWFGGCSEACVQAGRAG
jgi:hypothetical protein